MYRAVIAGVALLAATGAASAESFTCRSLSGDPPVLLDFGVADRAISSASFQIEDDMGYSTTADEPTSLATISGAEIGGAGDVAFKFHYADASYDGDVASVHVVTLSEGAFSKTAGVLQVSGGGVWAIECDVDYES